jgi:hypothetical protein
VKSLHPKKEKRVKIREYRNATKVAHWSALEHVLVEYGYRYALLMSLCCLLPHFFTPLSLLYFSLLVALTSYHHYTPSLFTS